MRKASTMTAQENYIYNLNKALQYSKRYEPLSLDELRDIYETEVTKKNSKIDVYVACGVASEYINKACKFEKYAIYTPDMVYGLSTIHKAKGKDIRFRINNFIYREVFDHPETWYPAIDLIYNVHHWDDVEWVVDSTFKMGVNLNLWEGPCTQSMISDHYECMRRSSTNLVQYPKLVDRIIPLNDRKIIYKNTLTAGRILRDKYIMDEATKLLKRVGVR